MRTEAELRRMLTELADMAPDPAMVASEMQLRSSASQPVWAPVPAPPKRRPASLALAVCICIVLAVGLVAVLLPALNARPEPAGPPLEPRYQGTVTIEPSTANPGEWVTLDFPDGGHGTNFTLETWTGSDWELSYYLVAYSMSGRGWTKSWWGVNDPGGAMPEPAGWPTERVIVPPVAATGVHRLCELGDGESAPGSSAPPTRRACGLLTVT